MRNFINCDVCPSKFKVKKYSKPFIGYVDREPVYKWFYRCPNCEYEHVVRLYHSSTNKWYDKMILAKVGMQMYRYTVMQYQKYLIEYEIAKEELDKANKGLVRKLNLSRQNEGIIN
ncbi:MULTISPECIES: hypothetical protein [Cytobacillus]|uniref:hypothetical protein n=1 Tax=Cytobacillus TaxID=2675230 RepID=UPI00203FD4A7|nr:MULTISPECIES: hypothetical protein [Cytobacillus]MCM3394847.1 hypothetical protein [Cytobacillus oceanisediminis]UQX56074.1 hypothetical protein M5V91_10835 [Cytobacillus pseudoceanisediminis]